MTTFVGSRVKKSRGDWWQYVSSDQNAHKVFLLPPIISIGMCNYISKKKTFRACARR